jgi:SNF2 family DNA or RNA helicase
MSFREIFEARKKRVRFLVHEDYWVDTMSREFSWMEGLDDQPSLQENTLTVSRAEYLRFLALHDRVEKHFPSSRIQGWFQDLELLKPPGRLPAISDMKGKLRGYQKNGYGWLWFLYENRFSGLLCDDMGLGKTHQIMALMTGIVHRIQKKAQDKIRFLVICPTTVLSHWKDKVMHYAPHLDPYIYHGTDRSFQEGFDDHLLIITSYGIALRDIEMLADYRFELIVLDEIQAVKNKSTKTYAAVKALEANCTIGLTGTPIENSVTDLKSLFDIILPGYLMSDSLFESHFRLPIEEGTDQGSRDKLSRMIHPFTLRRKKDQVLRELPPKIEDVRHCSLSDDQRKFYRDVVENRGKEFGHDPERPRPARAVHACLCRAELSQTDMQPPCSP